MVGPGNSHVVAKICFSESWVNLLLELLDLDFVKVDREINFGIGIPTGSAD